MTATVSLAACNGSSTTSADATSKPSSPSTERSTVPPTGGDPASPTTPDTDASTPTAPGGSASSASSPFCQAASALQTRTPDNPTPEQVAAYVKTIESAAERMVATAPDRDIVPVIENLKKAFGLYTTLAGADPNEDPAAFQAKAEEAERLFPAAEQQRFAVYVKSECGFELPS